MNNPYFPHSIDEGITVTFGVCGPATCSPEMLNAVLNMTLKEVGIETAHVFVAPGLCQKQEEINLKPEDIATM